MSFVITVLRQSFWVFSWLVRVSWLSLCSFVSLWIFVCNTLCVLYTLICNNNNCNKYNKKAMYMFRKCENRIYSEWGVRITLAKEWISGLVDKQLLNHF